MDRRGLFQRTQGHEGVPVTRSRSLVDAAAEAQAKAGYQVDVWIAVDLQPLCALWQGIGGHSDFFFSEEDAREARGAYAGTIPHHFAQTLWRLSQVQPNAKLGFRQGIREFVVDIQTRVAMGICRANGALGSGSVVQYYRPDWSRYLHATGREHRFPAAAFP